MSGPIRVLVVDDLGDWRMTLSGLLNQEGFDVVSVGSRTDAQEALRVQRFHVAVIDVRLDETDEANREGLALMHEIRNGYPSVAVIVLTGYADVGMVREALEPDGSGNSPAFGFLVKTEMAELPEYVRRAVQKRQLPVFEPSRECEITISIGPGERPIVRGRGNISFTYTSANLLALDEARFERWGSERLMTSADRRFLIKEVGRELYRLLFEQHTPLLNGYNRAVGRVTQGQYLHFVVESTRGLAGLPFEFLFSDIGGDYIALLHPLTRQIRGVETRRGPLSADLIRHLCVSNSRLRILLLVSNVEPRVDLIDEIGEDLARVLSSVDWLDVTLVRTEDATYEAARRLLRSCKYHIVHYVGHGYFDESAPGKSSLFFWQHRNRSGRIMPMAGNELRYLLDSTVETRLVHLTSCEGGRAGNRADLLNDDYLGIADSIIHAGVPSVLGYRWPVGAEAAKQMALTFYHSWLLHGSVELAVLDARREQAVRDKDELTWASPILIAQS